MFESLRRLFRRDERQFRFADYGQYVASQVAANHAKIDRVWLTEAEAAEVARQVRDRLPRAARGLCHGSRNGWEVRRLAADLGHPVEGTDISDTAEAHGLTRHDFHDERPDWVAKFDWVYSNSLDHAYDPRKALRAWLRQLAPGGLVVLHWSPEHDRADHRDAGTDGADSFQASLDAYRRLAAECGRLVAEVPTPAGGGRRLLLVAAA